MQLFDLTQPGGPLGLSKSPKELRFQVLLNKSWEFGVLHETKLEDHPETITFAFIQLFDLMHP